IGRIYPNNYKYSTLRAWLNGKYETGDPQEPTYQDNGFLQKAFTATAQSKIKVSNVDTFVDKIFVLTKEDTQNHNWELYSNSYRIARETIRRATDYAKANYLCYTDENAQGGLWWTRTFDTNDNKDVSVINVNGLCDRDSTCDDSYVGIVPALRLTQLPQ
nr:DUF6273 domain-containing protein [Treponema sp.]